MSKHHENGFTKICSTLLGQQIILAGVF